MAFWEVGSIVSQLAARGFIGRIPDRRQSCGAGKETMFDGIEKKLSLRLTKKVATFVNGNVLAVL